MYLDYYGLSLKPFQISTDPRFLWFGEKHQEALAVLKYGILDNKGFLLLTGDVGTGKTTLLNALVSSLGEDVLVAMVADPGLAKMDFFNFVADSFGMKKNFKSKGEFLIYLKNYLISLNKHNKQALLIIDECQHLTQKLLEEIRLLSNIEKADLKLINIFFVGQSEFNNIILKPQNRAIRQRITINYNINALSEMETDAYILYRLSVAGSQQPIFSPDAIKEIYTFSNGYPRLINIICDQALLTGFVREKQVIDRKIIVECSKELRIERGISIEDSDATPEARMHNQHRRDPQYPSQDEPQSQKPSVQKYKPLAAIQNHLEMKTPLAMALIIILIIWVGLITIFLFSQKRSGTTQTSITSGSVANHATAATDTEKEVQENDSWANDVLYASQQAGSEEESDAADGGVENNHPSETKTADKQSGSEQNRPSVNVTERVSSDKQRISLEDIQKAYGTFPEVHFAVNSNRLNDDDYDILAEIALFCMQQPETILILRGYTDLTGVRAYNMKLAEFRADVVKTYLIGKGVKLESITTMAIGPDDKGPGGTTVPYDGDRRKVMIEIITPAG